MALISFPSLSSSSNTCQFNFKHDVLLSFRGEDTHYNFTSHLHKALRDKQIQTYIDYKLNRGDEISPSLLKAIEESKISAIIFSKDYASSRWCLQELVKILECKKSYGQIVIPVFYNIVPTDVRNQTGTFGDAFTKRYQKQSLDQVQRWKEALNEAANLSGLESSTIKDESVLIENIVKHILKSLNDMSSSDAKSLVGIDTKIEQIVSLLEREDVRIVGIWGIRGIGMTTLAEVVFNRISSQFEGFNFIPNIREEFEPNGGLNHLRRELLSTLLEDGNLNIGIMKRQQIIFFFNADGLGNYGVLVWDGGVLLAVLRIRLRIGRRDGPSLVHLIQAKGPGILCFLLRCGQFGMLEIVRFSTMLKQICPLQLIRYNFVWLGGSNTMVTDPWTQ